MRKAVFVWIFLFSMMITLACTSAQAATIYGGKVFHSQNFTSVVGGQFKIYGLEPMKIYNNKTGVMETHYKKATINSDIDESIELKNGTCGYTLLYKYCFKGSSIDFDNPYTFSSSEIKSVMSITIESLPPSMTALTVKRNMKVTAFCGELIPIDINLTNGGTMLTNISYSETLPENTMILSTTAGKVDLNILTITDTILPNTTKFYRYTMVNFDCQSKNWSGKYSFVSLNGTVISKNITNMALIMNNSFRINETLLPNKTNGARDEANFTFWINNTHKSSDIILDLNFIAPELVGVYSLYLQNTTNGFKYSGVVSQGRDLTLKIRYKASEYGNFTISTFGTISIGDYKMKYNSSKVLEVIPANVLAYIEVNNYTMNNSLTVSVWAQNDDIKQKYYYIYGFLRGFGDEEPIYINGVEPNSKVLITKKSYNITNMGEQELFLEFDGVYRDLNGVEYDMYDSKIAYINGTNFTSKAVISKTPAKTGTKTTNTTTKPTVPKNTGNKTVNETISTEPKKDLITRMVEGLNNFFQSIFG